MARAEALAEKEFVAPLMKWPGGKRALIAQIIKYAPQSYGTYFEPFFGGGALFFALQPSAAILADLNTELIDCYKQVKDAPHDLVRMLRKHQNTEYYYYRLRNARPRTELSKAARLIYLMRLSFNGIHRVNLRGEFNVPYGYKTHLSTVDQAALVKASEALRCASLRVGDFERTTSDAKKGDFIYFDPPYTVAHASNGFVKYNEHIFSWSDQERLAEHAKRLAKRGCHVLVSNASHSSILALYKNAKHVVLERNSVIAASSCYRKKITESLFILRSA